MTDNTHSDGNIYERLDNPFTEDQQIVFEDRTDSTKLGDNPVRVELRVTRNPATLSKLAPPSKRIVDKNYVIGMVDEHGLPREGEDFEMYYHILNDRDEYGSVGSNGPISNLIYEEDCFYFTTSEGQWRLKVLDTGN